MACSKHYNLKVLVCSFQTLNSVRPYIDPCINNFPIWKFYLKNHIRIISLRIIDTMNQRLIKIKDNSLLMIMFWRRKLNKSSIEVRCWWWPYCVYVLNCLQSLYQVSFMKFILLFIFLAHQNISVCIWLCALRKLSIFSLPLFYRDCLNRLFPLNKLDFGHELI